MFAGRLSVGLLPHQWLCYVGALLGGSLSYLVFFWILFPGKDSHRAGRRMLREDELARAAKELERRLEGEEESALFFAGHWLPFEVATSHFLVMGATNTGKTLIQRMLMQCALKSVGTGRDQRAIVFNAKQDVLSILAGMKLSCPVVTLDPFDARMRLGHGRRHHDPHRRRDPGGEPRANR